MASYTAVLSQCFSIFISAATPIMPMALTCDPKSQKYTKANLTLEKIMKIQRAETTYSSTLSLNLALDGGGWSTPLHGRLTPGKDPRAGLDGCAKSRPPPRFDLRTAHPVASRYTDLAIQPETNICVK